jgi:hypothetical protein
MTFDANQQPLAIGSGFYVSTDGEIATNFHVVKGARSATVREHGSGAQIPITAILSIDYDRDLVLLKASKKTVPVTFGNSDSAEVGDKVVAIGNPQGLAGTVSEGIISGIRNIDNDFSLIQITAPISPGSSGGPLFDSKGNVIGVTTAYVQESQNLNFAVPGKYVKGLLINESHGTPLSDFYYEERRPKISSSGIGQNESELVKVIDVDSKDCTEFSIYNGTSHSITKVRILIIMYDYQKSDLPVQSEEFIDASDRIIRSHLSLRCYHCVSMAPMFEPYWTPEIRILDYENAEE